MPQEAVWATIAKERSDKDEYRPHARMRPSQLSAASTCRRQVLLTRHYDYYLDPRRTWSQATEGTLLHEGLAKNSPDDDYVYELEIPNEITQARGLCPHTIDPADGKLVMEVFPGVWLRGRIDRPRADWYSLTDYKFSAYPIVYKKDQPPPTTYEDRDAQGEWAIQLSTYRHMVRLAYGVDPQELWVWRMYRGSKNAVWTARKIRVRSLSYEDLWSRVRPFVEDLTHRLQAALDIVNSEPNIEARISKLDTLVAATPTDGYTQFIDAKGVSGKCRGCPVKERCDLLAGRSGW